MSASTRYNVASMGVEAALLAHVVVADAASVRVEQDHVSAAIAPCENPCATGSVVPPSRIGKLLRFALRHRAAEVSP